MGLLDSVIGGLLGGGAGASSPMGNILSGLLGGGQSGGFGGAGSPGMSNSGMGNPGMGGMTGGFGGGGMAGGLGGLVSQFENAGLGNVVQSWIGNGPNQQVSPQQLNDVFGQDQVQGMAAHAGLEPGDFLSQLSQHLPNAVNGMTPDGQLPGNASVNV